MDAAHLPPRGVTIRPGLAPSDRPVAARLYLQAFFRKLAAGVPDADALRAVVEEALRAESVLVARDGGSGRVLGICGFAEDGRPAVDVTWKVLRRHLGVLATVRALLLLAPLGRSAPPQVLLLDGIAVDPSARGRGLGTALLEAAGALARERGRVAVRLSVVDTNPGAARLYDRLGFQEVAHGAFGPLAPVAATVYGITRFRVLERSVR